MVSKKRLTKAIKSASEHHHNYEKNVLKGKRDKNWAGWYSGHVFGKIKRLQKFLSISELTNLLEKASKYYKGDNWAKKYSGFIIEKIRKK